MSVYDDLINILFKLPDGRNMEEYFKNVLLLAYITSDDLKDNVTFPESGVKKYASYDEVKEDFKVTSRVSVAAQALFNQKNNTQTTSQVKYLIVAEIGSDDTIFEALDRAKSIDGKFVKVITTSREAEVLTDIANWCQLNDRFCDLVVTDVTDVTDIKNSLNNYAYGIFRKNQLDGIDAAIASTSTCGRFGSKEGSAQFSQLSGILPESYTGQEISEMKSSNVAFYTNVSVIDGGDTADFGYNWVIGSRMLGGELRQREMIKHYIKKSIGLMSLEFFNKKPMYDETGNNLLLAMAQKRFRTFQEYNLIIPTTSEQVGFELQVAPIRVGKNSIMNTDTEAYNAKRFKLSGYYYDAIVGEKVDFSFSVDPSEEEVSQILGGGED